MAEFSAEVRATFSLKNMGQWKARVIKKANKGSRTTGKQKGIHASALERYMCRANRSWKHPEYQAVMSKLTGEKRRSK